MLFSAAAAAVVARLGGGHRRGQCSQQPPPKKKKQCLRARHEGRAICFYSRFLSLQDLERALRWSGQEGAKASEREKRVERKY